MKEPEMVNGQGAKLKFKDFLSCGFFCILILTCVLMGWMAFDPGATYDTRIAPLFADDTPTPLPTATIHPLTWNELTNEGKWDIAERANHEYLSKNQPYWYELWSEDEYQISVDVRNTWSCMGRTGDKPIVTQIYKCVHSLHWQTGDELRTDMRFDIEALELP